MCATPKGGCCGRNVCVGVASQQCITFPQKKSEKILAFFSGSKSGGFGSSASGGGKAGSNGDGGDGADASAAPLMMSAFTTEEEWRRIDKKVNKYPGQRTFTAIGAPGDGGNAAFRAAMLAAVERVVGAVHVECVSERPSSGGKYLSVRVGPVFVQSADQVVEVFAKIRADARVKWFM